MIRYMIFLFLAALVATPSAQSERMLPPWNAEPSNTVRIPIDDPTRTLESPIGPDLVLMAKPGRDVHGFFYGWDVGVFRRTDSRENLLEHDRTRNGPFPTDVYAWSQREHFLPNDRRFRVYGLPYEVRVLLLDCTTASEGDNVRFTEGYLEVSWRRTSSQK